MERELLDLGEARAKTGAVVREDLKSFKACLQVGDQVKGTSFLVRLVSGTAIKACCSMKRL